MDYIPLGDTRVQVPQIGLGTYDYAGGDIIAYSPLAKDPGRIRSGLGRGLLEQVADLAGKTQAQVALNWCISKQNVMAIPKSSSIERTEENCGASGWSLTNGLCEGHQSAAPCCPGCSKARAACLTLLVPVTARC